MASSLCEDFPVETFRHPEQIIGEYRRRIMNRANEIARREYPHDTGVYTVTTAHIERAWKEVKHG